MGQRLTPEKIAELYAVWLTNRSVGKTGTICGVDERTVERHRRLENWDAKADKITKQAVKRIESEAEKRTARHVKQYQFAQHCGVENLKGKNGRPVKMKPRDALHAIDMGVRGEREILGETDTDFEITIKLPKGLKLGFKPYKSLEDNE